MQALKRALRAEAQERLVAEQEQKKGGPKWSKMVQTMGLSWDCHGGCEIFSAILFHGDIMGGYHGAMGIFSGR